MSSSSTTYQAGYCKRNAPGTAIIIVSSILFAVATLIVPTRLWVRARMKKSSFGWDDVCLLTAYIFAIPTFALIWRMLALGLGRHVGCYSDDNLIFALKLEYIAEFLMIFSTVFSRTSVALFVTRLFATTKKLKIALYCYTVFMAISLIVTACLELAECTPIQALWNYHLASEASCWSTTAIDFVDYYNSAVSILSDFLLAMLPTYFLSKLQMSSSLKVGLMALMAVGLAPMGCAICRTIFASTQKSGDDPLYTSAILIVFGTTETIVLIICASIPALMPIFHSAKIGLSELHEHFRSWSGSSRGGSRSKESTGSESSFTKKPRGWLRVGRSWSSNRGSKPSDSGSSTPPYP